MEMFTVSACPHQSELATNSMCRQTHLRLNETTTGQTPVSSNLQDLREVMEMIYCAWVCRCEQWSWLLPRCFSRRYFCWYLVVHTPMFDRTTTAHTFMKTQKIAFFLYNPTLYGWASTRIRLIKKRQLSLGQRSHRRNWSFLNSGRIPG